MLTAIGSNGNILFEVPMIGPWVTKEGTVPAFADVGPAPGEEYFFLNQLRFLTGLNQNEVGLLIDLWPSSNNYLNSSEATMLVDWDGDSNLDIITTTREDEPEIRTHLNIVNLNGQHLAGSPIIFSFEDEQEQGVYDAAPFQGEAVANFDTASEPNHKVFTSLGGRINSGFRRGYLMAYEQNMNVMDGFPKIFLGDDECGDQSLQLSAPLIASCFDPENLYGQLLVHGFDEWGNNLEGFPFVRNNQIRSRKVGGILSVGNIQGDGKPELLISSSQGYSEDVGDGIQIFALDHTGELVLEIHNDQRIPGSIYDRYQEVGAIYTVDIDEDPQSEILVPRRLYFNSFNEEQDIGIILYDNDGTPLQEFIAHPVEIMQAMAGPGDDIGPDILDNELSQISIPMASPGVAGAMSIFPQLMTGPNIVELADLDGDGNLELVTSFNASHVPPQNDYAFNHYHNITYAWDLNCAAESALYEWSTFRGTHKRTGEFIQQEFDCPNDLNRDGVVDVQDFILIMESWGYENDDGTVGAAELIQLILDWGECS
jgi:hypothetical protein